MKEQESAPSGAPESPEVADILLTNWVAQRVTACCDWAQNFAKYGHDGTVSNSAAPAGMLA